MMLITKEQSQIINQCKLEMSRREDEKKEEVRTFERHADNEVARLADELIMSE